MSLANEYNQAAGIQAVNPSTVMRELMDNVDVTRNIVYVLCAVILIMNLFIVSVITMLNMYDTKKDIELFRLIGVSKGRIKAVIYIQNLIVLFASVIFGFALSRVSMIAVGSITEAMGIVLDTGKLYALEYGIAGVVAVTAFLPLYIAVQRVFAGRVIDEK